MDDFDDETGAAPHDKASEQALLGMMLLDARCIPEVAAICPPTDFYQPYHVEIAEVLVAMNAAGRPTEVMAVHDEFMRRGRHERVGGAPYLLHLLHSAPAVTSASYYAGLVARHAQRRHLIAVGTRLVQMGADPATDLDDVPDLYAVAMKDLTTALDGVPGLRVPSSADLLPPTLDGIERPADLAHIPTGIHDLDALFGGWAPGQLIIVGARPSIGKSTFAFGAARHAAIRCGVPTLMCTLEMGALDVMRRVLSAEAKVVLSHILYSQCDDSDWDRIERVAGALSAAPLFIDETPGLGLGQLRHMVAELKRTAGLGLLIIDYVQLMGGPKSENRQQQLTEISRGLKVLAKEFAIPVIALAQLNRKSEDRTDKRPQMSDLRESGSLEADADTVILMHREDFYQPESPRAGECDLIVPKNRSGPTATVTVAFQGHYARCVDMARDDEPLTSRSTLRDVA